MTDQKEGKKPLTLSTASRSAAAKADATQVKQKFSHGRTRQVTVEVKKVAKRPPGAPATPAPVAEAAPATAAPARTLKLGGAPAAASRVSTARASAAPAAAAPAAPARPAPSADRKSTRLNSSHTVI